MNEQPIGFLDSGLGGLSVVKEVKKLLPRENIEYFADNLRQPYGEKSQPELVKYTLQIVNFLLKKKIKVCVIACNTATAASLTQAKNIFNIPIMGVIQPAVQDAIKNTSNNRVGVIATEFTTKNRAYPEEIKKIAPHIEVFTNFCPEFVPLVESGKLTDPETYTIAQIYLKPLKDAQIDTLILGCTHYSFLKKVISKIMGPEVILIDPAISTSLILKEILSQKENIKEEGKSEENYYTTGSPEKVERTAKIILNNNNSKIKKVKLKELE
ncbi:MAG: glutamate racemase [Candidatus Atribacteria bacterium]|nr:glutamate racemase [Candidatus Atribacteria bacterium]MCK4308963.1 glutamate racemase [Candidatus Atribacteria bacterium]